MKLIVLAIDALSMEIITRNSFTSMDKLNLKTVNSTLPYITPPGWTTTWTGLNPSHHGIFGIQSLQDYKNYSNEKRLLFTVDMVEMNKWRIWDYLSEQGLKCVVRDIPMSLPRFDSKADVGVMCHSGRSEIHWRGWGMDALPENKQGEVVNAGKTPARKDPKYNFALHSDALKTVAYKKEKYIELIEKNDADVFFLGFHEIDFVAHLFGIGSNAIQLIIDEINILIEALSDYPVMIVSDHGFETYDRKLNLDVFLKCRGLFNYDEKEVDFSSSVAYPVDCGFNDISVQDWGVYLNTKDKVQGFLTEDEKMTIMTELIVQFNDVEDIEAKPKWLYYDPEGEFYDRAPDIVLSSPSCRTFIASQFKGYEAVEPYRTATHSLKAIFAHNFRSEHAERVMSLEDIYTFICSHLKVDDAKIIGQPVLPEASYANDKRVTDRLKELGYLE